MAGQLESLTRHLSSMEVAVEEDISEDDFQGSFLPRFLSTKKHITDALLIRKDMIRDVEELPAILSELEESMGHIESSQYVLRSLVFLYGSSTHHSASEQFTAARALAQQHLGTHHVTLDDLEELGDIMSVMLRKQQEVEVCPCPFIHPFCHPPLQAATQNFADWMTCGTQEDCTERLEILHHQLLGIGDLANTYTLYQMSFNKVLVEVARRREYKQAAEDIVNGMMTQLQAMADGEPPSHSFFCQHSS